ncbi:MAG: hypothetical protein GY811_06340 [Myxococcales bacterium]|nr:hypothetical protein [Myxococcales bacterium]
MKSREYWNACRYKGSDSSQPGGHYESWFQRANHPTRPQAFWIRYTIFSPKGRPQDALGELWAIYFDGEAKSVIAIKQVMPIAECAFSADGLDHRVGNSTLNSDKLSGEALGQGNAISWDLRYKSPDPHLLLLPESLYKAPFPKAKSLVGSPLAMYSGSINVNGTSVDIDKWVGSQNHNWGSKHTDKYAWGQVAGFDDEPDAFLEVATARVQLGPIWTPRMTVMVLRLDGEEIRLNSIPQSVKADGRYDCFNWNFESRTRAATIAGTIAAPIESFVGLPYSNPPGGEKTCLNTKIASCHLTVRRRGLPPRSLNTRFRAAFEILTSESDHKVPVLAGGA